MEVIYTKLMRYVVPYRETVLKNGMTLEKIDVKALNKVTGIVNVIEGKHQKEKGSLHSKRLETWDRNISLDAWVADVTSSFEVWHFDLAPRTIGDAEKVLPS